MNRYRTYVALFVSMMLFAGVCRAGDLSADEINAWNKALNYLMSAQHENGSWGKTEGQRVGISSVVLESWALAPQSIREGHPAVAQAMKKTADWIASQQDDKGVICDGPDYANYSTSLAVTALAEYDRAAYEPVIAKGVAWIESQQATEANGYAKDTHVTYGGFGYGSSLRPDLSNTWIALNALKAGGVPEDSKVWTAANVYVRHCQNSPEVNDQPYAGSDGGSMYLPDESPAGSETTPEGKTVPRSYGSMSYAMLLSYLWTGEAKDSTPVTLVSRWLGKNWSVTKNPGTKQDGQQGRYYYYRVMAKALSRYGEDSFEGHDWRRALIAELLRIQTPEGYWVNEAARWTEGDPALVTGYALTALALAERTPKE